MSDLQRNSFTFRIVDDWNALLVQVVEAETVWKFEIELDKHMGDKMLDF